MMCYCNRTLMDYLVGFIWIILTNGIHAGDNLALLSGTLKTFHKTSCESENVTLSCPRGTSISIETAQYEKSNNAEIEFVLCPRQDDVDHAAAASSPMHTSCVHSNALETKWQELEDTSWVRYSLLQTAIEACQKKPHCKFLPAPKSSEGNPCPGVRRVVSFAYKCRPYEFRSKVACENEIVQLTCNPYSRIAIYSASYGRTEYESIQCAQPQGVREETCLVSYATETVMQICHGRRRCSLSADTGTFGNPCRSESRMYLKTVYTCVSSRVLKDEYDISHELDEISPDPAGDHNDIYDDESIPPAPKLQGNHSHTTVSPATTINPSSHGGSGGTSDVDYWIEDNNDFFYVYVVLFSTVLVLVTLIMAVVVRIVLHRRNVTEPGQLKASGGDECGEHQSQTNVSDQDIDLTTPMSIPSISKDDQMGSTYTAGAYAHLEPGSMTYTFIDDPDKSAVMPIPKQSLPITTFRATKECMNLHPTSIPQPPRGVNLPAVLPPIPSVSISHPSGTLNRQSHHFCISVADPSQYYYG